MNEARRQCSSCPFREDASEKFAAVLRNIVPPEDLAGHTSAELVSYYRELSRSCALDRPDNFACHSTVYDSRGKERDMKRWRECKGAQRFYEAAYGGDDA